MHSGWFCFDYCCDCFSNHGILSSNNFWEICKSSLLFGAYLCCNLLRILKQHVWYWHSCQTFYCQNLCLEWKLSKNGKHFLKLLLFLIIFDQQFLWFSKFHQLPSRRRLEAVFSPHIRQLRHFILNRKDIVRKCPNCLLYVSPWHQNWVVLV